MTCDEKGVTFKWKDYRIEGPERYKIMTLAPGEFIRRFLIHVLPAGFHRIRYYGLLASGKRAENVARGPGTAIHETARCAGGAVPHATLWGFAHCERCGAGADSRRDVTVGPKIAHEVLPLGPSGYAERW